MRFRTALWCVERKPDARFVGKSPNEHLSDYIKKQAAATFENQAAAILVAINILKKQAATILDAMYQNAEEGLYG